MDLIQDFQNCTCECQSDDEITVKQDCNSGLSPTTESETSIGSFDCNICFDLAHEPVVTLCGHLYCWACIFKWLHVQSSSSQSAQQTACPVCKANISQSSLIPLYCHGPPRDDEGGPRKSHHEVIPPRPTAVNSPSNHQLSSNTFESHHPAFEYGNYAAISSLNHMSPTMAGIINSTIELLGELVYTRSLGGTDGNPITFPIPNWYAAVGSNNSSSRMRRQELQVAESLNRVSIFLFVCVLLCLLLF